MVDVRDPGERKGARVFAWWMAILGVAAALMPILLQERDALAWTCVGTGAIIALVAGAHATRGGVTTGRSGVAALVGGVGGLWILVHPYLMDASLAYRYGLTVAGLMLLGLAGMELMTTRRARPRGRAAHR